MNLTDTIVAPASAPGWSPRAFIRVSGPGAFAALPTSSTLPAPPTRGLHRLHWPLTPSVRAEQRKLPAAAPFAFSLPVLALLFPSPASYTGEDSFELQLPGNPNLVDRIVRDLASRPGFRLAEPGEFTARAYLHNKLTLDQAEGVAATIAAQNDDQLRAASQLLGGRTGAEYRAWANELTTLLALTEAGIDFTDQDDVVAIQPATLRERLIAITDSVSRHTGPARAAASDHAVPTIALFGIPNAGKSTLFNALLGRPRAVVSDVAGTTRDVLAEPLELSKDISGGPTVLLCDLPGQDLGPSSDIDRAAQAIAAHALATADVLLWCDPTGRFESGAPQAGTHAAPPAGPRLIRVRTKADLPVSDQSPAAIAVCALDGYNLRVLRRAIADQASSSRAAGVAALLPRHRRTLESTLEQLRGAIDLIAPDAPAPAELVALRLRTALDHLGELIGHVSPDDVIGRVFATFCVGK